MCLPGESERFRSGLSGNVRLAALEASGKLRGHKGKKGEIVTAITQEKCRNSAGPKLPSRQKRCLIFPSANSCFRLRFRVSPIVALDDTPSLSFKCGGVDGFGGRDFVIFFSA